MLSKSIYDTFFNNKPNYQIVRGNLKTNKHNWTLYILPFVDCDVFAAFYDSLLPLQTTEYPFFRFKNIGLFFSVWHYSFWTFFRPWSISWKKFCQSCSLQLKPRQQQRHHDWLSRQRLSGPLIDTHISHSTNTIKDLSRC